MEKTYQGIIQSLKIIVKRLIVGIFLTSAFFAQPIQAQNIKLISDEETEAFLAEIIKPLFKAAGIKFYRHNLFIVEDSSLNAFVADGNRLFIHTGTLIKADNVNELSGVLAHETGHIMGGHLLRQKLKMQDMQEVSLISAILAGTGAVLSGRSDVAMAVILGGQSSMLHHYTGYRTGEERSADEAAVKLLTQIGQSTNGILKFMKKIVQENQLAGRDEIPYFRTHPVTRERIAFFEQYSSNKALTTNNSDEKFLRIKAKLRAYLLPPEQILKEYPLSRTDIPAQYAQSIALLKQLKFDKAITMIDKLLNKEPDNPFLYELKGQILIETGQLKLAKQSFAKAYDLLPYAIGMQINYAQAILEDTPSKQQAKQAADMLNKALLQNKVSYAWMLLSKAYGIMNDMASANYAAAEYSLKIGNINVAKKQLKEAEKHKTSSQLKLKIEDLKQRLKHLDKDNI